MPERETIVLKNNELLEIECLTAPLAEDVINELNAMSRIEQPWKTGWDGRVAGKLSAWSVDRYIVGRIAGSVVGRIWYTVSGHFATLGFVLTAEKHQGKGIAGKLLDYAVKCLDSEDGLMATYLGVGPNKPVPRAMYTKAGWLPYNDARWTCIMRRFKNGKNIPEFDSEYFQGQAPYSVRLGHRADLPGMEALYNLMLPDAWFVRNQRYEIYADVAVECQIDAMFNDVENNAAECFVLEDDKKALLGISFITRGPDFSEHLAVMDFFISPLPEAAAEMLVKQTLLGKIASTSRSVISSQSSGDIGKNHILEAMGFKQAGIIAGYFRHRNIFTDKLIWEK